jgi:oligopeptide/dipeptide ABC transporter ATP-binding protein
MNIILKVINVKKYFPTSYSILYKPRGFIRAVDGVSFEVLEKERFCIIGESGSGKTTLGKILSGLIRADSGEILLEGLKYNVLWKENKTYIYRNVQMIYQDPYSSLNPRKTIRKILERPFKLHKIPFNENTLKDLLELVGLSPANLFLDKLPSQLSGGQRQRVVIARAIALNPKIIVADEPVSMLDATVKIQILRLLQDLHRERGLTYIMISHEIPIVASFCDRVAVMYMGKIVELAPTGELIRSPKHPYTQMLVSSVLLPDPETVQESIEPGASSDIMISSDVHTLTDSMKGCRYRFRCPFAMDICNVIEPGLAKVYPNTYVACHLIAGREAKI